MSDDHRVVMLDTDAAEELLDLVKDVPGEADEDRLDDAFDAIRQANGGLSGPEQQQVAKGQAIAFGITPDEQDAVVTLIADNVEKDKDALRSVGQSLKAKLKAARKKMRGKRGGRRNR